MKKTTDPPRLAIWLLTRRLSAEWRDFVVGDLEEEFGKRSGDSPVAGHAWFWWQTMRCLAAPPPVRPNPLLHGSLQGDSRMRAVFADLRYAFRAMSRTPSLAVAVVSVLALGIGANTAIFSIVNAVLLRPLHFEEPERLVRVFTRTPGGRRFELSPGKFYDWQRDAQSFEGMAMYQCCGFRELALTGTGTARTVRATAVSAGFFEIVRARPALGRVFRQEEDTPRGKYVVVLGDRFWRTEFGGNPDVIGRTVKLNDEAYTIVGVMPATASFASWAAMASDVWVPLALTDEQRAARGNHNRDGVARLKRDVELAQAQAEMDAISARLAREFPKSDDRWGAVVIPMKEEIVANSRTMLLMLLGAVGLVLLIACANVGNLLLTRALSRRKEIAIRLALGAARGRVFQQLLTEALLLAGTGGALGLLLAYGTLTSASTLLAGQVPRAEEISIDGRVLLFAVGMSMLTGMLAGTLPAVRAGRSDLNDALKEGGRSDGAIGVGTRRLLIVCEVALSLVLLMGAGVMVQSLLDLRHVDTGFDPNNVLTMRVRLVEARYPTPGQRSAFFEAALQRIRALPGVEAAGTIDDLPFADGSSQTLALEGYAPQRNPVAVQVRQIIPGYLRAMGIPVLRGRDILDSDAEVLLVSQDAAKLYWGADDAIGRRAILPALSKTVLRQVVGIVGDVKQRNLIEATTPTVYLYTREPYGKATFVIRTSVLPATLAQPAVAAVRAIDPEQPVEDIRTMVQVLDLKLTSQRFSALLLGVFAGVALLLAAVGIYSILSYIVRGRSREIGIRTALGARTADILRLVIVEGMSPALVGIAVGTIAALASARVMAALVFGVSASDPLTLAAVAATLALIALLASLVPAYRALRLDPVKVLRAD
ncbi:MAG: ABC transporter permease [Acidobacteria bacterium]|nr:MAG: ABC transporter permease [Acidobacteriota bacterium]